MFIITDLPVEKLVKGCASSRESLASLLPEDALLSRIALMSILGFSVFKVSESVARPRQNPDRTAFRNRALIIYPGSEDFVLKIQFPCYRQIFVRRCASPRFRPRSPCTWPRLPTSGRLLYYRKYLSSSFFLSSPLFIYLTV